ncbi:hypothetical protein D9M71_540660 [compost metagenome]
MLAVVVDGFAFQHPAPDAGELHRGLVALFVAEEQAVTGQLLRIATGDQVEQGTTTGKTIQGRRLTRCHGRRDDPRTQGYQELQALGHRNQRSGDQPGVLAGTPGGDQHTAKAEAVSRLGNLLQVAVIDGARAFGGAKVMAVAMGWKKPEYVEAHWSCLLGVAQTGAAPRRGQIVKGRWRPWPAVSRSRP